MRGRKPEPIDNKRSKGTARDCRLPNKMPGRVAGAVKMPDRLSPGARPFWAYYCKVLGDRGQLSVDSVPALEELCETEAAIGEVRATLREHGRYHRVKTYGSSRSKPTSEADDEDNFDVMWREHPAAKAEIALTRLKASLLTEFGLTDASRSKVDVTGDAEETTDPGAQYGIN